MLPWRLPKGKTPLLYQASLRLLGAMTISLLVIVLMTLWIVDVSQDKAAWREIRNATEYFSEGIKDRERRWEEAAVRYKSHLEFARMLEDPAQRWTRLSTYLSTQSSNDLFPALLLTDVNNRVLFSFGLADESVPRNFARPPDLGWHFDSHSGTLYRYYVLHMWLGVDGMGHLVLLRPMDQGLLNQFATLNTNLFLRWRDKVIASSLGDRGLAISLPRQGGQLEYDGTRFIQGSIAWDEESPDSPEFIIHRQVESLFDYWEIAIGVVMALNGILAALWPSIGFWVYRTTRRIGLVGEASRRFTEDKAATPEIRALLEEATRSRDDEINEVACSIESLTATVAQRDRERDAYERTLRESEARLREITSVLADGVYVLDSRGTVTFVNPEAERLLGWPAAELIGRGGHNTFHYKRPDGTPVPHEDCPVHQAMRHGQSYRSHHDWLIHRDGTVVPVSIVANPIIRDGQVAGSVAAFHDITPRLEAERVLRESEERFRLISTSAMDAILIMDDEERITYWNPAAERTFGYAMAEVLGRNLHDLITPERYREDAHRGFQGFRRSGQGPVIGRTVELSALRRNGEEFPIEMSVSAIAINDQWHALGLVRDISERKKAEEQIRQLAYYDTLTNLPNRRLLVDRLHQALAQAKRHRRSLAVMFLDLDRFKIINDTLGHDVGDGLLQWVAARLSACVRSGDTVARQGGDEFVIVLAEVAQPADAGLVAEKIIDQLQQPAEIKGHSLHIGVSIGIAIHPADGGGSVEELMKQADQAMYAVKEAGRNGYRLFGREGAGAENETGSMVSASE